MNALEKILEAVRRPAFRAWLYRVVTALGAVLLGYGIVSGEELAGWIGLAGALLGTSTAARHTPVPRAGRRAARPRDERERELQAAVRPRKTQRRPGWERAE